MAVVVSPTYSIQAVAGKHSVIEGRAVVVTNQYTIGDLPGVEYPDHLLYTKVWVAFRPPTKFPIPVPDSLYVAPYKSTYNINDPTIYSNPMLTGTDYLVERSQLQTPTIEHYEKVALFRGIVGITSDCYQDNAQLKVPGALISVNPNGLFRKHDQNHHLEVAETVYYDASTAMLYINVF